MRLPSIPGVGICGVFPLLIEAANIAACAAAWKPRLPTPAIFSTGASAGRFKDMGIDGVCGVGRPNGLPLR